jgi:hypothetical protein
MEINWPLNPSGQLWNLRNYFFFGGKTSVIEPSTISAAKAKVSARVGWA